MVRVNEIRYVGYGVRDLEAERVFYRDHWGLREVAEQDDVIYFASQGQTEHHVVRLRASEVNRIDVIALSAANAETVDQLYGQVIEAGCQVIFEPRQITAPGGGYGFRFFSPDGIPFEISSDVQWSRSRAVSPQEGIPERISHIVLHSPDPKKMVGFFSEVLGFRVSDWISDFMGFLRCNSAHHRIAVMRGPPCLNHVAYDVASLDSMMRGIGRLCRAGSNIKWGPGRHLAGDNTFAYFTTPNGFAVEYTSDLEEVDDDTHKHRIYEMGPNVLDQWGFAGNGPQHMPSPQPDPCLFRPAAI